MGAAAQAQNKGCESELLENNFYVNWKFPAGLWSIVWPASSSSSPAHTNNDAAFITVWGSSWDHQCFQNKYAAGLYIPSHFLLCDTEATAGHRAAVLHPLNGELLWSCCL